MYMNYLDIVKITKEPFVTVESPTRQILNIATGKPEDDVKRKMLQH